MQRKRGPILVVILISLGFLVLIYSQINRPKESTWSSVTWGTNDDVPSTTNATVWQWESQQPIPPTTTVETIDFGDSIATEKSTTEKETKDPKLLVDTEGCKIAKVDPFDPRLKIYYEKLGPEKRESSVFDDLVYLTDDKIVINRTAKLRVLTHYKMFDERFFSCCVSYFRIFSLEQNDNEVRFPNECQFFLSWIAIEDEYMKINCFVGGRQVYEKFDVKVVRKSNVEARCRNIMQNARERGTTCNDELSVLILGIDSLSRLNFHRQLPETRKVLMEELDAIEFVGYNKAGEYTYVCLMPFLAGMLADDLEEACGGGNNGIYDPCRLLWDVYGAAGYRTAFVENMNQFGLFTHARAGYRRQPTDYYGRTFFNAYSAKATDGVKRVWRNVSSDEAVFQWAIEFQREFHDDLHFGHFWISDYAHDDSNTAGYIDPFLSQQLMTLKDDGLLNSTLLILISDHGMRFGKIRKSEMGRFEAKLPLAFFVFPRWFQDKHPDAMRNFRRNAHNRFTTAFDFHRTLEDLAKCSIPAVPEPLVGNGTNLFSNISPRRTCKDAGIGDTFCACQRKQFELDLESKTAKLVAGMVVDELARIAARRQDICAILELYDIVLVKGETDLMDDDFDNNKRKSAIFTVQVTMQPGYGLFEGTVTYNAQSNQYLVDALNIQRINRYGTTADCVTDDPRLKPVCYCLHQTDSDTSSTPTNISHEDDDDDDNDLKVLILG